MLWNNVYENASAENVMFCKSFMTIKNLKFLWIQWDLNQFKTRKIEK